jgi:hypothetical protein
VAKKPQPGKVQLVIQPKFAAEIQSLPSPLGVTIPLQRGYMIWSYSGKDLGYSGGELGDGRDIIHFLFNPSTVTANYQIGDLTYQAVMQYSNPLDQTQLQPMSLSQTVNFDLYFDRTYELNYGGNSSAVNDPAVIGVQADVYQFMQFTGVTYLGGQNSSQALQQLKGDPAIAQGLGGQILGTLKTSGLMQMMPCHVFFGNALAQVSQNLSSANFDAVSSQVQYYGYISGWSVTYTHWTAAMVPIRAVINVTFTMLANPTAQNVAAVWRDNQKLGTAPYYVQTPFGPNSTSANFTGTG